MGKTRQLHRGRARDEGEGGGDGTRIVRLQELIREEVNLILRNEVRVEWLVRTSGPLTVTVKSEKGGTVREGIPQA